MTSRPKPSFTGKITVASRNNTLYWNDSTDGDLSATIANGDYWPADLASAIASAMNIEATATAYACAFDVGTCKFTLSADANFYPKTRPADTNNLLSGGHQDLTSTTLPAGGLGLNHLGYFTRSINPSASSSFEAEQQASNCWAPDSFLGGRLATDDEGSVRGYTADAIAVDGSGVVLDFTPLTDDADDYLRGDTTGLQKISFENLSRTSQDHFILWMARTVFVRGQNFRYYPDRDNTPSLYYLKRLTQQSRAQLSRGARKRGYSLYNLALEMEHAKA